VREIKVRTFIEKDKNEMDLEIAVYFVGIEAKVVLRILSVPSLWFLI
jgi:hypothetical protein